MSHYLADTQNDQCLGSRERETTEHFLLNCQFLQSHRDELLSVINPLISNKHSLSTMENSTLVEILLYGDKDLSLNDNQTILKAIQLTISYTLEDLHKLNKVCFHSQL